MGRFGNPVQTHVGSTLIIHLSRVFYVVRFWRPASQVSHESLLYTQPFWLRFFLGSGKSVATNSYRYFGSFG